MKLTIAELAKILKGEVIGDGNTSLINLAKIEEAKSGDITFISNPKYIPWLYKTGASVVVIDKGLPYDKTKIKNLIIVDDAYLSFNNLLNRFSKNKISHFGLHIDSRIHESVKLGDNVSVGQFSVIGPNCNIGNNVIIMDNVSIQENVTIGDDCVLYSGVRIYDGTFIGNQCIFHSNCVIGSDGFGFAPNEVGEYVKTPQLGNVKIGNKVEIHSLD